MKLIYLTANSYFIVDISSFFRENYSKEYPFSKFLFYLDWLKDKSLLGLGPLIIRFFY